MTYYFVIHVFGEIQEEWIDSPASCRCKMVPDSTGETGHQPMLTAKEEKTPEDEEDVPVDNRYVDLETEEEMEEFTILIFHMIEQAAYKPFASTSVRCPFCDRCMHRDFLSFLQHSEGFNPSGPKVGNKIPRRRALVRFLRRNVPANLESMVRARDEQLSRKNIAKPGNFP